MNKVTIANKNETSNAEQIHLCIVLVNKQSLKMFSLLLLLLVIDLANNAASSFCRPAYCRVSGGYGVVQGKKQTTRFYINQDDEIVKLKEEVKQKDATILDFKFQEVKTLIHTSADALKSELKTDIEGVKTDVAGIKTDIAGIKTDVASVKKDLIGIQLALVALFCLTLADRYPNVLSPLLKK